MEIYKIKIQSTENKNYYITIDVKNNNKIDNFWHFKDLQIISNLNNNKLKNKIKLFNGNIKDSKICFDKLSTAKSASKEIFEPSLILRNLTNQNVIDDIYLL